MNKNKRLPIYYNIIYGGFVLKKKIISILKVLIVSQILSVILIIILSGILYLIHGDNDMITVSTYILRGFVILFTLVLLKKVLIRKKF